MFVSEEGGGIAVIDEQMSDHCVDKRMRIRREFGFGYYSIIGCPNQQIQNSPRNGEHDFGWLEERFAQSLIPWVEFAHLSGKHSDQEG